MKSSLILLFCGMVLALLYCGNGEEESSSFDDDDDNNDTNLPTDDDDDDTYGTTELEWVPIPGGTFEMGCSPGDEDCEGDEFPRHTVTITPF